MPPCGVNPGVLAMRHRRAPVGGVGAHIVASSRRGVTRADDHARHAFSE
jgi:hypothetical protein